jgi:hypothetical protein
MQGDAFSVGSEVQALVSALCARVRAQREHDEALAAFGGREMLVRESWGDSPSAILDRWPLTIDDE